MFQWMTVGKRKFFFPLKIARNLRQWETWRRGDVVQKGKGEISIPAFPNSIVSTFPYSAFPYWFYLFICLF